jgi:hypothetical protein
MANIIQKSYNARRAEMFGKKLTAIDKLIMLRSPIWTHTEVQFSQRYGGVSFSATMQDNANCCRFKQIEYTHQAERWDDVIIPMNDEQEDMAYAKAKELEGTPYDLVGLLSHVTPLDIIHPHKVNKWCTETVTIVIGAGWYAYISWLQEHGFPVELRPDEGQLLAGYYFRAKS